MPALQDLRILGVPVIWWVLGLLAYPALYLLARLHRRQAERIEREFTELLGQGPPAGFVMTSVDSSTLSLIAIALVVIATGVIGAYGVRFARTTSDFLVASRTVRPAWNAAAISGEYLSAASFLGVAGLIAVYGPDALWYPVGFTAGYLALQLFVAAPLRRSGAYTVPDFAQIRWGSRRLRGLCTALVLAIAWLYLVPQLHGAGLVLREVTGLPRWVGVTGVALVVTLNVVAGGMRSITLVQAMQYWFKVMAIALPVLVVLAVNRPGVQAMFSGEWADAGRGLGGSHPAAEIYSLMLATFLGHDGSAARAGAVLHQRRRRVGPRDDGAGDRVARHVLPVPDDRRGADPPTAAAAAARPGGLAAAGVAGGDGRRDCSAACWVRWSPPARSPRSSRRRPGWWWRRPGCCPPMCCPVGCGISGWPR